MELRIKAKLSPDEENRWQELKKIFGIQNNAKVLKKLLEVIKL